MPAFTSSSLNLPIAVSNSVPGMTPASESLLAFTITLNRIVTLRVDFIGRLVSALINQTNRGLRYRHVRRNYFGGSCFYPGVRPAARFHRWLARLEG